MLLKVYTRPFFNYRDKSNPLLIPAIIFGILYGASHMINIGLISVFYVLSLLITSSIRNRILTHKNYVSIFFLCVTFNMFFVLRVVAENLTFTLPLIQEMIFGILLNATLTFLVFVVINFFRHQMERRFLGTNVI